MALNAASPEALRERGGRLQRQCRERLEHEAATAAAEHAHQIEERAAQEAETGRKLRGRKPKPVPEMPAPEAKAECHRPRQSDHEGRQRSAF